jgi:hypothetical protein
MNYELRKSDSLAQATGSFKQNLEEINLRWNEHIVKLGDLGPQIIEGINESIEVSKNEEIVVVVKSSLSEFVQVLNGMDKTNADIVDLMIEMEGLDFPLKAPKRILILCEKEEDSSKMIQNIVRNLSKTYNFFDKAKTDKGLLLNSLNSFEIAFADLQEITKQGLELTAFLETELEKEHKKAKKYLGKV